MKVLYVSHTAQMSGAERSLLELIALARVDADVLLASPPGELLERARSRGIATAELSMSSIGFSTNLLAATVRIGRSGWRVRALARSHRVDVVHAASPRAGLLTACCIFSRPRRVVDVRDVLPTGARAAAVRWALRLSADMIVFNSRFTRDRFGPTSPANAAVMYPPVEVERLLELPLPSPERRRRPPMLGLLGQITPWKGQDDAIRILAAVRTRVPEARLRIVGSVIFSGSSVAFDNESFERGLPLLAAELGVAEAVELTGQTDDLEVALGALDVLLVPSWAEPFGRVVVEGMAGGVPVVATRVGGPSEIVEDGVSGFLAPPKDPAAWLGPVASLLESVELARQVAESARQRVLVMFGDQAESSARLRDLYAAVPASQQQTTATGERLLR